MVLKGKSKNHIDVEVLETGGQKWRFTGIYGEPELKYKSWGTYGVVEGSRQ